MKKCVHKWLAGGMILFSVAWILPAGAALPWSESGQQRPSIAPMLKNILPGVVNVSTVSLVHIRRNPLFSDPFFRRFFNVPDRPRKQKRQSLGSGVVVDASKGYVLTNNHVIADADEITVTLRDGRHFKGRVVGTDPAADLAVLQIKAKNLAAVPFEDSDKLQVGDFVVAIGNPFGLGQTVTSGIISALGRSGLGIEGYEDFIQTDASINPGNSGGALVDFNGKLVGINTAIVGPSGGNVGIGFAIPSNMARGIMTQLIRYGKVRRGQLGVMVQNVTSELADALGLKNGHGAVIARIVKGSAAEKAGLKVGDVVVAINEEQLRNSSQLRNEVGMLPIGTKVSLEIVRQGKHRKVTAVIAKPQQLTMDAEVINKQLSGIKLGTIEPNHPLAGQIEGVEVLEVKQDSAGAAAGLRKGDIIVSVNQQAVASVEDVRQAVKRRHNGLLMNIRRGNSAFFIVIR